MKIQDEFGKLIKEFEKNEPEKCSMGEQWWNGLLALLILVLIVCCFVTCSCGGTFTLSPTGAFSYTTPRVIYPTTPSK